MAKRILSILLVTLMSIPSFTPVFAEGSEPEPEKPEEAAEILEEETAITEEEPGEEEPGILRLLKKLRKNHRKK